MGPLKCVSMCICYTNKWLIKQENCTRVPWTSLDKKAILKRRRRLIVRVKVCSWAEMKFSRTRLWHFWRFRSHLLFLKSRENEVKCPNRHQFLSISFETVSINSTVYRFKSWTRPRATRILPFCMYPTECRHKSHKLGNRSKTKELLSCTPNIHIFVRLTVMSDWKAV